MYRKLVILALIFCTVLGAATAQQLWNDFDTDSSCTFEYREGALEAYSPNPDPDSVNMSATCAKYLRNAGTPWDVIVMQIPDIQNVADYKSGVKKMRMLFYSPSSGVTVRLVMETAQSSNPHPQGRHSEYNAVTTIDNGWEWIEFTYSTSPDASAPDSAITQLVMLIDPANLSTGTYYFDSIMAMEHGGACDTIPTNGAMLDDFEFCQRNLTYDFIEGWLAVEYDSSKGSRVGDYVRNADAGSQYYPVLGGRLLTSPDLSTYRAFSIDIKDTTSDASEMIFQLNGSQGHETKFWTDPADKGNWVTYTRWISSEQPLNDTATSWLALFDAGSAGYDKFLFDNFQVINPCSGEDMTIMEDYECNRHLNYSYVDTVDGWHRHVENPDKTGINTSDMCGKYIRHGDYPLPSIKGSVISDPDPNTNQALSISIMDPTAPSTIEYYLTDGSDTLAAVQFETTASEWTEYFIRLDPNVVTASSQAKNWELFLDPGSAQFDSIFIDNIHLLPATENMQFVGVKEMELVSGVFPNPFSKSVMFQLKGEIAGNVELQVYDLNGKRIDRKRFVGDRFKWDVPEGLSEGMYFYELSSGNHKSNGKLIYRK